MNIRSEIIAQFKQVADEQGMQLASLTDQLTLLDAGLDSLCFAMIVAKLEVKLGVDLSAPPKMLYFRSRSVSSSTSTKTPPYNKSSVQL